MAVRDGQGKVAFVILAAGQGTRMKSDLPKVLHDVGGLPMLHHSLDLAASLNAIKTCVVVGKGGEQIAKAARDHTSGVQISIQDPPLGTAHAVLAARKSLEGFGGDVIVLYADTPLIQTSTIDQLLQARRDGAEVAVLGFNVARPNAYGRLVIGANQNLEAIIEARDATSDQLQIELCNSGVMALNGGSAIEMLDEIGNDNAKGEYYLTDLVEIANRKGGKAVAVICDETEVMGVNSRQELAQAEAAFQKRMRIQAMENGVTLLDPDTVYFSHDTKLGRDVVVGQHVVFGPGVVVEDYVEIRPFCHFEQATVKTKAIIGPYARLRPGADIGEGAHIGNFVEVKKATIEEGAKVNHLTYIGDAYIGAHSNIGAGTITCNYDGFEKHLTEIGRNVFIGSNNSLVAPVKIKDGAYTGSGSVISKDVAENALGLERAEQEERPGWAESFRNRKQKKLAEKKKNS